MRQHAALLTNIETKVVSVNSNAPSARKGPAGSNNHFLTAPLLLGAPKIGDAARNTVLWGIKKHGISGTGIPIEILWGIAADRAARACAGGGPLSLGGSGMAGGDARLRLIKTGTVVAISAVAVALTVREQMRNSTPSGQSAPGMEPCGNFHGAPTGASKDVDNAHVSAMCPLCENGDVDAA